MTDNNTPVDGGQKNSDVPSRPPMRSWVRQLQETENSNRVIVGLLFFIALVLVFYLLQVASMVLVPITFAWLLYTLFQPVVHWAMRYRIPPVLSAGVLIGSFVTALVFMLLFAIDPATEWIRGLPGTLNKLRQQLGSMQGVFSELDAIARQFSELADLNGTAKSEPIEVKIEKDSHIQDLVIDKLPSVASFFGISLFLAFFLLSSGNQILRKVTPMATDFATRRRIVGAARHIRVDVARYLATVTAINITLGLVVALALHLLGVPSPFLWGMVAGLLNFAPYVGPAVSGAIMILVGVSTFDTLGNAFAVPAVFLVITIVEGQLITPMIVGRRLALSPATVFLAVVVWGWLWGMPGALMAVPIVASLKIISENIPALSGLAKLVERT